MIATCTHCGTMRDTSEEDACDPRGYTCPTCYKWQSVALRAEAMLDPNEDEPFVRLHSRTGAFATVCVCEDMDTARAIASLINAAEAMLPIQSSGVASVRRERMEAVKQAVTELGGAVL